MAQIVEILEYLRKYPVFNNLILQNKLDKSREYTKLYLYRLKRRGYIHEIERNKYTLHDDAFLIASRIIWPSYASCWTALNYHHLTEQIPHVISVITTKSKKPIKFRNTLIEFIKINKKKFFGYEKARYNSFEVFIADAEKSIIDSALLRRASFSEIMEIVSANINEIRINTFLKYIRRAGNKSLIKRFGYLLEILGKDYYKKLKSFIDAAYIPLDYSKKIEGKKNKKWRLIVNA